MNPKAVLFDLGNVVFRIDIMRVFGVWSEHSGVGVDELRRRFGGGESFRRFERGEIEEADYFDALRAELGLGLSREQMIYGWNSIYAGVVAGVPERIAALAERLPIYAFTNTNPTHQQVWQTLYAELLAPFRRIYVSSDIGRAKPDAEAFRWVAADMGMAPDDILFLDDHAHNVEGAREARMNALHIEHPDQVLAVIDALLA